MKTILIPFFACWFNSLQAQTDTLTSQSITPVTVTATRLGNDLIQTPFAISVFNKNQLQAVQQQLSVFDVLATVPGVFVQNPDNFAQDLRISIRGFGARAAFGIRGIRIITDGIPESTPDGQADVDNLDLGALQSMEVLRGAASALYGNASGGVIYLKTEEPPERRFAEFHLEQGSYGFQRYQLKTGFRKVKWGTFLSAGFNRTEGYREHAAMRQLVLNNKWVLELAPKTTLKLLINYGDNPQADDAGGLTVAQITVDRRQARPQNVQFDAGESVRQGRLGALVEHRFNEQQRLTWRAFGTARQFDNRVAFQNGGVVEIDRLFGGGGMQYEVNTRLFQWPYRMQVGLDLDRQRDHRRRFNNDNGKKGLATLDQKEKFGSIGAYWIHHLQLAEKWSLTASTRFDQVRLATDDFFRNDGDQSDALSLKRFSPLLGLSWKIGAASALYGNTGTNFESPTLNELSANPTNTGGFNPGLKPQKSWNAECGLKARLRPALQLEAALFLIDLHDEFVPYQLPQFPGRSFYRNAGKSRRQGLEASLVWNIRPDMTVTANYTYSDFRYAEYRSGNLDYKNHRTPGIPQHFGFGEWRWTSKKG
ncbi:MAG: TonB-dependent receptor, partial [Saprospiraceae bacterium]